MKDSGIGWTCNTREVNEKYVYVESDVKKEYGSPRLRWKIIL